MTGGKYHDLCEAARKEAQAEGCILMIFGGKLGSGFSAHIPESKAEFIPGLLRNLADSIEEDLKPNRTAPGPN